MGGPQQGLRGHELSERHAVSSRESSGGLRSTKTKKEDAGPLFADSKKNQLSLFNRGGAVKAPLANRAKYHYTAARGTAAEHCGNCSMFRAPHKCTAVGGWIVAKGKCDIW